MGETFARALSLSVLGFGFEIAETRPRQSADIQKALDALANAGTLVAALEQDLGQRTAELEDLQREYERYSRLVDIEEEKAQAVLNEITNTLTRGRTTERVIAFGINLTAGAVFFVLGIVAQKYVFGS